MKELKGTQKIFDKEINIGDLVILTIYPLSNIKTVIGEISKFGYETDGFYMMIDGKWYNEYQIIDLHVSS